MFKPRRFLINNDTTINFPNNMSTSMPPTSMPLVENHPPSALLIYLGYVSPFLIALGLINNSLVLFLFRSYASQTHAARAQNLGHKSREHLAIARTVLRSPLSLPATPTLAFQVGFGRDAHPIQVNRVEQVPSIRSLSPSPASASASASASTHRPALAGLGSRQSSGAIRTAGASPVLWQRQRNQVTPIHLACPGERITATFYCFLAIADIIVILSLHLSYFLGDGVSYVFGPKYGIYWDQWSNFTCKARAYAYITAEVCSNVYAAFFSVVRTLALYKPLFAKRYFTLTRIRHLLGIMLAYILIVCTPTWYIYEIQPMDPAYSSSGRVCLYAHRLLDGGVGIFLTLTGVNSLFLYPNLVQLVTTALMVRKIHQLLKPYHHPAPASGPGQNSSPGVATRPIGVRGPHTYRRDAGFDLKNLPGSKGTAGQCLTPRLLGENGSDCELVELVTKQLGKKSGSAPEILASDGEKAVNASIEPCAGVPGTPLFSIGEIASIDTNEESSSPTAAAIGMRVNVRVQQNLESCLQQCPSASTQTAGYRLSIALGESERVSASGAAQAPERVTKLPTSSVTFARDGGEGNEEGGALAPIAEECGTTPSSSTTAMMTDVETSKEMELVKEMGKEMGHVQSKLSTTRNSAPELESVQRQQLAPCSMRKHRSASIGNAPNFRRVRTQQQSSDGSSSIVAREMRATLTLVAIVLTRLLFYLPLTILWTLHFTNLPERFGFQSDSLLVGVAARTVLSFSITMHVWNLYFYILTVPRVRAELVGSCFCGLKEHNYHPLI